MVADHSDPSRPRRSRPADLRPARSIEWPTVAVALAVGTGVTVAVATHHRVPAVVTIAVLGVMVAWYGSLRHEVVHGHPTPWRAVNRALVAVPLGLTEPFWHYDDVHVRHHRSDDLTDPRADPESGYLCRSAWSAAHPVVRAVRIANTTLAGRLVVGPWLAVAATVRELAALWRADRHRGAIVRFVLADALVLAVVWRAGLPLWQYVLGAAYLGTSLTLVRSYAEHRAVAVGSRTAVVQGRGFWALLFLNNNLHITHHRRPELAWYRLPAAHEGSGADEEAAAGAGLYGGYAEIFRRHLFRPLCEAVDPLDRESVTMSR